jgi:hypothetical protein
VTDLQERFQAALGGLGLDKYAEAYVGDDSIPGTSSDPTEVVETDESDDASSVAVGQLHDETAPIPINLFQHPDAHPIVLDLALLRKYGPEWMMWEPETLQWRIPQDFRTRGVSELAMHKLQALKTLHFVDTFWLQWEVFLPCCMAFNDTPPDFEVMLVPTVAQAAIAVDVANRIRQDVKWSDELKDYLEQVHIFDGVVCPIEPLDFVTVDSEEYPVDCSVVSAAWPDVRASGRVNDDGSVEAAQLKRLLQLRGFVEESRERLKQQLPLALGA